MLTASAQASNLVARVTPDTSGVRAYPNKPQNGAVSDLNTTDATMLAYIKHKESSGDLAIKNMVEDEFGAGHVMVRIAESESHFSETAANPKSTARGVFQILVGTFNDPYYGCAGDRMKAQDNIDCARKIYDKSGTKPWNSSYGGWGQ